MAKHTLALAPHTAFTIDTIVTSKQANRFMKAGRPAAAAKGNVVNYTPEQTAMMLEQYTANPTADTVAKLAKALGKTARSIIAKLSREKVYKAKTYATKTGEAVISKEALADKLTKLADLTAAEADSFTKANKTALKKIVALLEEAAED
jgi:hypothetical protein